MQPIGPKSMPETNRGDWDRDKKGESLRGRPGAFRRWANTSERTHETAPTRRAFMSRFERELDPDGTVPEKERMLRAEGR